jgi:hypothetical protein
VTVRTAEPLGDPARNAAALVELYASGDHGARAALMEGTLRDYHTPAWCPASAIAAILADQYAALAAETGTPLAPRLAEWRAFADTLDTAG